jgi:hypothetical protein
MFSSQQLFPEESQSKGFRRWEDKVKPEESLDKFTDQELEDKERSRITDFNQHKEMISLIIKSGVKNFNMSRVCNAPLHHPYLNRFLDKSTTGLPVTDGCNVFDAIFLKDKSATPQEKIAFTELLIEEYGYILFVIQLLQPQNEKTFNLLLTDSNYIEFLQRLYIHFLRQKCIPFTRIDFVENEKRILTALSAHYNDGGKQVFHNFISNGNLSGDEPFSNPWDTPWIVPTMREHIDTLNMKDFQRNLIMIACDYGFENYSLISQDAKTHKEFLGVLRYSEKSKLYAYLKVYFNQFNDYPEVIQACHDLTSHLNNNLSCALQFDHVVKKYADLRILAIAKQNPVSSVPQEVKQFLNLTNRNTFLMSSRSSFHLVDCFFSNSKKAAEIFSAKEQRVEARFRLECNKI